MASVPDLIPDIFRLKWYAHERDQRFLFQGSQETIVKELKAWVVRRKEFVKQYYDLMFESQAALKTHLSAPNNTPEDAAAYDEEVYKRNNRCEDLRNSASEESARAEYLLHTLKFRGLTWPVFWWRPDVDGGATLTILEARDEEMKLQADRSQAIPRIKANWDSIIKAYGNILSEEEKNAIYEALEREEGSAGEGQVPTGHVEARGSPGSGSGGDARPVGESAVLIRAEQKMAMYLAEKIERRGRKIFGQEM